MSDDFTHLVSSAQGEGPSEEFRARLRTEIVARSEGELSRRVNGVAVLDDARSNAGPGNDKHADVEIILGGDDRTSRRTTTQGRQRTIAAAAAVLVVAGIGLWLTSQGDDSGPDTIETIDTPSTTVPVVPEPDPMEGELVTSNYASISEGTFRVDTLGTQLQFNVSDLQIVSRNQNGQLSFAPFTSSNVDDRMLTFRRTPLLPDPSTPTGSMSFTDGWPADDLDGWVASLDGDVVATDVVDAEFGGLAAEFVELTFDCDTGVVCVPPSDFPPGFPPLFNAGSSYQLWVIDQGVEDPIVVTASIDQSGDRQWFEQAAIVLDSIEFGAVRENPVRLQSAGRVELDVFDGVRFDLPADVLIEEPYAGVSRVLASPDGVIEMLTRPLDTSGAEVTSADQLIGLLRAEAVDVDELSPVTVDGVPVRVLSIDAGAHDIILLKTRPAELVRDEYGWQLPCCAYLWIIEHPERGLLMISAQRLSEFDDDPELLRSWVESMLSSLEFVDS